MREIALGFLPLGVRVAGRGMRYADYAVQTADSLRDVANKHPVIPHMIFLEDGLGAGIIMRDANYVARTTHIFDQAKTITYKIATVYIYMTMLL